MSTSSIPKKSTLRLPASRWHGKSMFRTNADLPKRSGSREYARSILDVRCRPTSSKSQMSPTGRENQLAVIGSGRWPGFVPECLSLPPAWRQRKSGYEAHLPSVREVGQGQVSATADIRPPGPNDCSQSAAVLRTKTGCFAAVAVGRWRTPG